jgi:glycosyltransferase involved in cell wall biosynthesis
MNILLNLIPIKSGGGQKVATNFIKSLLNNSFYGHNFCFAVTENSFVHEFLQKSDISNVFTVKDNIVHRLFFERLKSKKILKQFRVDIIYSLFGSGYFDKNVPQVCGIAFSNIFYPEVDFWEEYKGVAKLKRKFVDYLRTRILYKSQGLIFENMLMLHKSHEIFNIPEEKTIFIAPSISIHDSNATDNSTLSTCWSKSNSFKVLLLCGWQRNKNIHIIPEIASELKKLKIKVVFVITVECDNSADYNLFQHNVEKFGVADYISLIGKVPPDSLEYLYGGIDCVLLLSKLESFSNNIIESWYYKKPLIISKKDWAESICSDGAIYVNRDCPISISRAIVDIIEDSAKAQIVIAKGIEQLKRYPTIDEKVITELEFLKYIKNEKSN